MSWNWLEETLKLQRESFKVDPPALEGAELADYVLWNHSAAVAELSEFLDEVHWKPWSVLRGRKNDELAIGELIDVAHFIANLAVAMGCTDDEWERRYREKMEINAKRQRDGYDGRNKCPGCGRALDDPNVACIVVGNAFICQYIGIDDQIH